MSHISKDSILQDLVENHVASRIGQGDTTLFDFDDNAVQFAKNFMGWRNLASKPPISTGSIKAFAKSVWADGLNNIVLLGQGGSTQAPMTITKYNKSSRKNVTFRIIDSVSPVRVREFLETSDPYETLIIVSSKSGGTIEPNSLLNAIVGKFAPILGDELSDHLVAITDPGSSLEERAMSESWRKIFSGEPTVGGRYSALSVFGLVPAALAGIDIDKFMEHALLAENRCKEDKAENPAIDLAAFLYSNLTAGRDKFSFLTPKRGRVLGLWIEQLIAESLGKGGHGIVPNLELDSLLLAQDRGDRSAIMYETPTDSKDEQASFELSLDYISDGVPKVKYTINSVYELAEHFVMWEYATAMCGYLMRVCPFDQPDVASTKAATLEVLESGKFDNATPVEFKAETTMGHALINPSKVLGEQSDLHHALKALFSSIKDGDYFSVNAFIPFTGEGRREALDQIRVSVARTFGVMGCLEIGPRFLHSTGQLQKGGPNNGVFLVISADELEDIELAGMKAPSLGVLARAQACGDMQILSDRDRRALHIHLPNNSGVALRLLRHVVRDVLNEMRADHDI